MQAEGGSGHVAFRGVRGIGIGFGSIGSPIGVAATAGCVRYADEPYHRSFSVSAPIERLRALRDLGFDHVRLNWNPGPAMEAIRQDRSDRFDYVMDAVDDAIEQAHRADLGVQLCMHLTGDAGVRGDDPAQIIAAGPWGREWLAYLGTVQATAARYAGTDPARFMLETFNEPPGQLADWRTRDAHLLRVARATMPNHTLTATIDNYSDPERADGFGDGPFDPNLLFVAHGYVDYRTSLQGGDYGGWLQYAGGAIPYPADPALRDGTIAAVSHAIARAPCAPDAKRRYIREAGEQLDYYFRYNRSPHEQLAPIFAWAARVGVPNDRIHINEFGIKADSPRGTGATDAVRLRWLSDMFAALDRYGCRWSVFSADAQDFRLTMHEDGTVGAPQALLIEALARV